MVRLITKAEVKSIINKEIVALEKRINYQLQILHKRILVLNDEVRLGLKEGEVL